MLLLRILFIIIPIILVVSYGLYVFTKNPAYLAFMWKLIKIVLFVSGLIALAFVLERYGIAGIAIFA